MSETKLNPTSGYPQNGAENQSETETGPLSAHDKCPMCKQEFTVNKFGGLCAGCFANLFFEGTGHVAKNERSGADNVKSTRWRFRFGSH